MTGKHPLVRAFLLMAVPPLAVIALLLLLARTDLSLVYHLLVLWVLFPLACILPAFLAGKRGLHPFWCTLPGFLLMLLPLYGAVGAGAACLVLGLVACVAGQEWQKQKNPSRSNRHGKK